MVGSNKNTSKSYNYKKTNSTKNNYLKSRYKSNKYSKNYRTNVKNDARNYFDRSNGKYPKKTIKNQNKLPLIVQIFIALVLGVGSGVFIPDFITKFDIFGKQFIYLIKFIVPGLVFFSVANAIIAIETNIAKIFRYLVTLVVITTLIATVIAFIISYLVFDVIKVTLPSKIHLDKTHLATDNNIKLSSVLENILNLVVPKNIVDMFAKPEYLQIVLFAIAIALMIRYSSNNNVIKNLICSLDNILQKMLNFILKLAPLAIFIFIGNAVAINGLEILQTLLVYIALTVGVLLAYTIIFYPLLFRLLLKEKSSTFFKNILPVQIFAFSTASSAATLPLSIQVAIKKLKVQKSIAKFVLPLCTTINMDGTAVYIVVTVMFLAKLFGIDVSILQYLQVVFLSCLLSIGVAGIPGGAIALLTVVISMMDLPIEQAIAVIIGVERILDMWRSVFNVTGDLVITVAVDKKNSHIIENKKSMK